MPDPDPVPSDAQRAFDEERLAYERDAERAAREALGLLRYVDKELEDEGVVIPAFDNPLDTLTYVAGIVETRRTAQDVGHRRRLIAQVRAFTVFWIGVVLAIVIASGLHGPGFELSMEVLVALVTTTTANVLGLAFIVLRGMFDHDPPDHTPRGG